jgi:hypothetical protein
MLKGALVGAVALTVGMVTFASAQPRAPALNSYDSIAPSIPRVTEANIARLKSALNLTSQQLPHWNAVESALRALAREQRNTSVAGMDDVNARAAAMAGVLGKMRHLAAVAAPLIQSLDETQRREAMTLVQRLGYDRLVASF